MTRVSHQTKKRKLAPPRGGRQQTHGKIERKLSMTVNSTSSNCVRGKTGPGISAASVWINAPFGKESAKCVPAGISLETALEVATTLRATFPRKRFLRKRRRPLASMSTRSVTNEGSGRGLAVPGPRGSLLTEATMSAQQADGPVDARHQLPWGGHQG